MIKEGIYRNLSSKDYHADKNSLSRSSIKDFYKNPRYYWAMHLNDDRPIRLISREMLLGSAFHTLILEPEKFDQEYAIQPERVLLKDVGREAYEEYKLKCIELETSNKIILTLDEFTNLKLMQESLEESRQALDLIDGEIEKSFFWQDKESELIVKARPDILHDEMIIDLKTIADASPYNFQRSMVDGWYHVQAAMIRDAVRKLENREINTVINLCVEKKYPFCVGIYIIDEAAIDVGEALYKNVLLDMQSCTITNNYKSYQPQIIGLPKWAM